MAYAIAISGTGISEFLHLDVKIPYAGTTLLCFWMAYVVTRPLGASFADYIGKPRDTSGIGFGDGATALGFSIANARAKVLMAPDEGPGSRRRG